MVVPFPVSHVLFGTSTASCSYDYHKLLNYKIRHHYLQKRAYVRARHNVMGHKALHLSPRARSQGDIRFTLSLSKLNKH